jgi:catechol 2,3-dioxygenase-like lactoylglutathione lyase family enzyme
MIRFTSVWPRLAVQDLPRTIAFYRDVLGFDVGLLWPDETSPTFTILGRDDVQLQFYVVAKDSPPGSNTAAAASEGVINIETSDVRELHRALDGHVAIEWGPEVYTYGRREFAVRDPSGYLVIFTEEARDEPTEDEP